MLLGAEHQLRQPLNAISLLIGELAQTESARERDAILQDLRFALSLSNSWLDALVELEKLGGGAVTPAPRALALDEVLAGLKDDFAERFAAQGIAFRVVNSSASVYGDPALVRRVLRAILENAVKFTREGKVILGVRRQGARARIDVVDSGLGIPAEDKPRIFQPFFRLENEVRPRERGLGIGLALARHIATLCGDSLEVESTLGRGSRVSLVLKTAAPEAAPDAGSPGGGAEAAFDMPPNPLEDADIVVFDNPDAEVIQDHLQRWGARPRISANAADKLAEVLEHPPALLVADMAGFDAMAGRDLLAAARERQGGRPAVVLLSDRGKSESAAVLPGPVHVLYRPVKPAQLRALCLFALEQSRG
ncbi:ATP-binding protein [Pelagibius sp.]|uniref:hybrid sensor histidine kinase/response regulator n=1 Tax=Pelagibius sp. TaxID=1931238 RepID=UPI003B5091CE